MARFRQEGLDAEILGLLDGDRLSRKLGLTLQLATSAADGTCHMALLSVGEVIARDDRTLALALHGDSQSTANLSERGRGLLFLVLDGCCIDVQLRVCSVRAELVRGKELSLFVAEVTEVYRDEVDYARVTGGVTFELPRPEEVVARWQETLDRLRTLPVAPADRRAGSRHASWQDPGDGDLGLR